MPKALSLKLDETIFEEAEKNSERLSVSRNSYINRAVAFYNRLQRRKWLQNQLLKESKLLKEDTEEFLKSFELLEDLPHEA